MTNTSILKRSWPPLERTPATLTAKIILTPTNDWRSSKTTCKMIQQLTANRQACEKLAILGIERKAILWHWRTTCSNESGGSEKLREFQVMTPSEFYKMPSEKVPAWTFAELCAMIGPQWEKPDLIKPSPARKNSAGEIETATNYQVYFPDRAVTFVNGADAAAAALIFLIENGFVKIADANARYSKNFKTQ